MINKENHPKYTLFCYCQEHFGTYPIYKYDYRRNGDILAIIIIGEKIYTSDTVHKTNNEASYHFAKELYSRFILIDDDKPHQPCNENLSLISLFAKTYEEVPETISETGARLIIYSYDGLEIEHIEYLHDKTISADLAIQLHNVYPMSQWCLELF